MNSLQKMISIEENRINIKYFMLLMTLAYLFSIVVRMSWIYYFNDVDAFIWNNELMINTNDGYYFAEGARDILSGIHQENDYSPTTESLSILTAFLYKIVPLSFETLILWIPTIFASLLVIPIMLIARVFKLDILGFCAALLGSIAWSYYNRTMMGYYDTDILIIVLPTFAIWGMLYALEHEHYKSFVFAPLFAIMALSWHSGTTHVINGIFIMALVYTIVFERKNLYYYKFLAIFVITLTTLYIWTKVIAIFGLVFLFTYFKEKLTDRVVITITILSALVYLVFGGANWIMGILNNAYITRALHADNLDFSLHYYNVVNTVREAGHIPFETFANRISGHTITFWLALSGYIFLLIRYRLFILTLPMIVLGFFAIQGGLRFTVFAVPFMALGVFYIIFLFSDKFKKLFKENIQIYIKYIVIVIGLVLVLYPNIMHIKSYKVPTVMSKEEVGALDKLKQVSSREDYVISWWDYGYPIRYYADVKTIIDGARHEGNLNYSVSFALLNNQIAAANMMRFDVEFTEKNFKKHCGGSMDCMLKSSGINNPNKFINSLNSKSVKLPEKTRDIYLFLPNRMLNIIPTIDLFSNLDLLTGKQKNRPFFYQTSSFKESTESINLNNNIEVIKNKGLIKIGKGFAQINQFIVTEYDSKGMLQKRIQTVNPSAGIYIIFMKTYNKFLVLDKRLYNSLFIQLFVLENYDKDLFEPIIGNPYAKVYKLKI